MKDKKIRKKILLTVVIFLFIIGINTQLYSQSYINFEEISQKIKEITPSLIKKTVCIEIIVGNKKGYGSGAIISSDGYILTCAHVVEIADKLNVILPDKRKFKAIKLGINKSNDYALIKIDAKNLPFFKLGNSDKLRLLQCVIALGHPGGPYPDLQPAVCFGIIRGLHKKLPIQLVKFYDDAIQTDAPIFAGNSGGPLVNLDGELIGINGAIMLFNEYAYSIPINEIKRDLDKLKNGILIKGRTLGSIWNILKILMEMEEDLPFQDIQKIYENTPLGKILKNFGFNFPKVKPAIPSLGAKFIKLDNRVYIYKIEENSISQMAGLKKGDEIIEIDGIKINEIYQIWQYINNEIRFNDKVIFTIKRKNKIIEIDVIFNKRAYSREYFLKRYFSKYKTKLTNFIVEIKDSGGKKLGYGAIISEDGWILTNYRIVSNKDKVKIFLENYKKDLYIGKIFGYNGDLDIALIKINPIEKLKYIKFGDDRKLKVGDIVISGGTTNFEVGIISALNRKVPRNRKIPTFGLFGLLGKPNKSPMRAYDRVIHHDSNINKDEFGSPLLNLKGEIIGINVANFYRGSTFAIPISTIKKILPNLKRGEKIEPSPYYFPYKPKIETLFEKVLKYLEDPNKDTLKNLLEYFLERLGTKELPKPKVFLGIKVTNDWKGVKIVEVIKGHCAERGGLKKGDIIIKINKQNINSIVTLLRELKKYNPGDIIEIEIIRNYKVKKLYVKLEQRND